MKLYHNLTIVLTVLLLISCKASQYTQLSGNPTPTSFSLTNESAQSIPLLIPGVMNPNLSPYSRSGVTLVEGQTILYRYRGKARVILTVDNSIASGSTIEVSTLLKSKIEEWENT